MEHYYYLHTNGSLIHKRFRPDPSDFIIKIWKLDTEDRKSGWILCIEALALGANKERVMELKEKWGLTNEDAQEFIKRAGSFIPGRLEIDKTGAGWRVTREYIGGTQHIYGPTVLEALAKLVRKRGNRGGKTT